MRPVLTSAGSSGGSGIGAWSRSERLEHELELARQVQQSLFPSPLPTISGVQLAAVNQPARIVSGDLYDVIVIDPERVAILCADVSGKWLRRRPRNLIDVHVCHDQTDTNAHLADFHRIQNETVISE